MENSFLETYVLPLFQFDSVWSVVVRFVFWIIIAITIIASVDAAYKKSTTKNVRSNLGLVLMFLIIVTIVVAIILHRTIPEQFPYIQMLLNLFDNSSANPDLSTPSPLL